MGTYHYEAVDQAGRSERGVLEAESERLARQQLLSRGLLTVSLKAGRSRAAARARSAGLRRTELSWLTRQLASLVAAGLSLEASLGVVIEQATRRPLVQLLAALRADIRAGQSLSDALANHPRDFPEIYRALVRAGEQSGELEQVLDRLASFIEDRSRCGVSSILDLMRIRVAATRINSLATSMFRCLMEDWSGIVRWMPCRIISRTNGWTGFGLTRCRTDSTWSMAC